MPPKKRHRRSASVPGGTLSESHIRRYFVRHRQNSGVVQPAVRNNSDVTGIVRPPVVTRPPVVSSSSDDVCRPAFCFSNSTLCRFSTSFTDLPLSSFSGIQVPVPVWPSSDCKVESVARPSASCMPVVRNEHTEASTDTAALQQQNHRTARSHSQPGALLTRTSSLKRRRDEYRPWLDFRKMRETAYALDCGSCARSRSSTGPFLSTNEEESQESLASSTDRQLTEKLNVFSLDGGTRLSEDQTATVISPQSEQQDSVAAADAAAAVLVDLMPGTCSRSVEDDEVAAINIGCEEPPPFTYSHQSIFTDKNSPADDLDLELIELN